MNFLKTAVLSLVLIMPGLAYGMGFNPFSHNSDNPGPPPNNNSQIKSAGPNSVPLPGTALAFGVGFLALAAWRRYRQP
jgi:hypothetical protein